MSFRLKVQLGILTPIALESRPLAVKCSVTAVKYSGTWSGRPPALNLVALSAMTLLG